MQTKLYIHVSPKEGELVVAKIDISHYNPSEINSICSPETPGDYEYNTGHFVEEDEFKKLKQFITELSVYNYDEYDFDITRRSYK